MIKYLGVIDINTEHDLTILLRIILAIAMFLLGMALYKKMVAADNVQAREQVYKDFYAIEEEKEVEYLYTTANLNVREKPSLKADIIKTVSKGTKISKIGSHNDWTIVSFGKHEYYMHNDYLSKSKPKDDIVYLGKWKITAYCNCEECCGKWAGGPTASGTMPQEGKTVACNSLPAGTDIMIDKHEYRVQDTGLLGEEHIDIYFDNHDITDTFGVRYKKVYLIK